MNTKKNLFFITILPALGIFFRVYYLIEYSSSPLFSCPIGPDIQEYSNWAKEILCGQFLWNIPRIHAPLYPHFLALCYKVFSFNFFYIRMLQELIGLMAIIPIIVCLRKIKVHAPIIWITLGLWVWYPPLIFYQGEIISESLVVLLLTLSILFLYLSEETAKQSNARRAGTNLFCAGFFLGLANITHPMSLFFTIGESFYLLFKNKVFPGYKKLIIIFFVALIIPILPIIIYNSTISKNTTNIQANSGFNFYLGNNPNATGTCYLRPGPKWNKIHNDAAYFAKKNNITTDYYFYSKAFSYIKKQPLRWLKTEWLKTIYVWNYQESTSGADLYPIRYFTNFQRYQFWAFGLCTMLAISGLFLMLKTKQFFDYRHFLILLFTFWLGQIIFVTSGRYRIPMIISIIPLAAYSFHYLAYKRQKILTLIFIIIGAVIAFVPTIPFDQRQEQAEALSLYGEAFLASNQTIPAKSCLTEAIILDTDNPERNYNLLGTILSREGNNEKAKSCFDKALAINKNNPITLSNLAIIEEEKGNLDQANRYYKNAITVVDNVTGKEQADVFYNYALFWDKQNQIQTAEKYYLCALSSLPFHLQALNNLGNIYLKTNRPKDAIKVYKTALKFTPDNPKLLTNAALALTALGNKKDATDLFNKAISIDPNINKSNPYKYFLQISVNGQP